MTPLEVTKDDILRDLENLGVQRGGLLFVHSSLSAIGRVHGGADAAADALLEAIGPDGTLVVPAFTYADPHDYPDSIDPAWVFDPVSTRSGMGAITNAVRMRRGALRSVHLWHSVAAVGPLAQTVVTADGKAWASAWDETSPMAWVFDNGGIILLLGAPYQNLTAVHIWEVEFGVAYRETRFITRRTPLTDGTLVPLASRVHARSDWHPGQRLQPHGRAHGGGEPGHCRTRRQRSGPPVHRRGRARSGARNVRRRTLGLPQARRQRHRPILRTHHHQRQGRAVRRRPIQGLPNTSSVHTARRLEPFRRR